MENLKDRARISVLTYDVKYHRKTYDVLTLLAARGYKDINVVSIPMHYAKKNKPLFEHRPEINRWVTLGEMCMNFDYKINICNSIEEAEIFFGEINLICGAGIIPLNIIKNYKFINSHPGFLPDVRGLDAFKWAIYEEKKIGVTTHILGDEVDAGLIIERKEVPVFSWDTIHSVAHRQYEIEVGMLVDAIEKVNKAQLYVSAGGYELHKRMPSNIEKVIIDNWDKYKMKRFGGVVPDLCTLLYKGVA